MKLIITEREKELGGKVRWSAHAAHFLTETIFPMIVKELGLTDVDEDVEITFMPPQLQDRNGMSGVQGHTEGDARRPLKMVILATDLPTVVYVLAHEMVHVRDMVRGDLTVREEPGKLPMMVYRDNPPLTNSQYELLKYAYGSDSVPSEREAYTLGPRIAATAMADLSDDDIHFLSDDSMTFGLGIAVGLGTAKKMAKQIVEKNVEDAIKKAA